MHRIVLAFPVVSGKSEAEVTAIADVSRSRPVEYREARQWVQVGRFEAMGCAALVRLAIAWLRHDGI